MRKYRQLHLWIGLLTSILILVEAVTGLLLSEPWLMGQTSRSEMRMPIQAGASNTQEGAATSDRQAVASNSNASAAPTNENNGTKQAANGSASAQTGKLSGNQQQGNSFVGLIHGLHEGRIGSTNVKWLADIAAIGLIILTITGISLSIQTLKAQSRSRKRRTAE